MTVSDSPSIYALLIGLATTLITSITAVTLGIVNGRKLDGVHTSVNSRLDEWKKESIAATNAAVIAAYKEGVSAGQKPGPVPAVKKRP